MPADLVPIDPRDPAIALPATTAEDPRVGHLLGRGSAPRVAIVGFPSDEGVRRNHGRPGAAGAPREIRRWLYRMTPDAEQGARSRELFEQTRDLGDVVVTGELEADQERLARIVAAQLAMGRLPVVLGGGHAVAYGHFRGRAAAGRPLEILNWDAHLDVREPTGGRGTSGTPFRQAIEDPSGLCRRYRVLGVQRHSAAAAHLDWVRARGGVALFHDQVDGAVVRAAYDQLEHEALVSFDLDAVDASLAPGVSAPATGGLPLGIWLAAAEAAGACPRVGSIDVAELNPLHDVDGRTARLAALTVWRFLSGLAKRAQPEL